MQSTFGYRMIVRRLYNYGAQFKSMSDDEIETTHTIDGIRDGSGLYKVMIRINY